MPIKPNKLELGDTIGLISPASAPPNPQHIDRAIDLVKSLGYKPKLGKFARRRAGFLAGSDRERAADFMEMFQSRRIKAIFCLRGGYGASRLLNRLDFDDIRKNPDPTVPRRIAVGRVHHNVNSGARPFQHEPVQDSTGNRQWFHLGR